MANVAKVIGFVFMIIAVLLLMKGLQDFRIYGSIFLVYAGTSFIFGVIIVCLGLIVENTARTAAAQERIADKLGNTN